MARRLLVLGGTGMLGHAAIDVLKPDFFDTVASVRNPQHPHARGLGVETVRFDARAGEIGDLIDQIRPDAVLNAIGLVKQLPDGRSSAAAIRMNALFPHELAQACTKHKCRLVHVSTDCVFAGSLPAPGRYRESDVPDARDVYGRSKLLGEVAAPHVTLRTSIIGRELGRVTGLMEWFVAQDGTRADGYRQAWVLGLYDAGAFSPHRHRAARTSQSCRAVARGRRADRQVHAASAYARGARHRVRCDAARRTRNQSRLRSDALRETTGYRPPTWNEMLEEYTARQ